ncbi:uncharacterized protein SETTUDRAFT_157538 [Exserohilum turcica Et28A]|uniref:Calcineurin-like phosphoesterase domain-containing protein n=1 Tax=Exserohilum turcicum (strain 28A) TaxID=671987 RepID=R0JVY8_EXST2|nr:uncharacterized protein SETTUDRAFT_157538 [Exserohilum turcica Et28A]EOA81634.1 hypothetical protein SETTUDRAFT_157538 [Exserohilum turcica Et28A]
MILHCADWFGHRSSQPWVLNAQGLHTSYNIRARTRGIRTLSTPVRFLILSDMHGAELPQNLPQCEVLLHCGNLTEHGTPQSISSALQNLSKVDARLKLVIAGNHEVSLDRQYWLSHGGPEDDVKRAHALVASNGEASQYGTNFLSEGTHTFNLPCGATFKIYASPYTPGNGASALQYPSSNATPSWADNAGNSTSIIPEDVDIVMTHGPPKLKPRLYCFGHAHLARGSWNYEAHILKYGAHMELDDDPEPICHIFKDCVGCLSPGGAELFRGNRQYTLCVNAAMEGDKGVLEHPPWLVALDLPVRS